MNSFCITDKGLVLSVLGIAASIGFSLIFQYALIWVFDRYEAHHFASLRNTGIVIFTISALLIILTFKYFK